MWGAHALVPPPGITALEEVTRAVGFTMRADALTLDLLRTLAGIKVAGHFLELGTGTGISAAILGRSTYVESLSTAFHARTTPERPRGSPLRYTFTAYARIVVAVPRGRHACMACALALATHALIYSCRSLRTLPFMGR